MARPLLLQGIITFSIWALILIAIMSCTKIVVWPPLTLCPSLTHSKLTTIILSEMSLEKATMNYVHYFDSLHARC